MKKRKEGDVLVNITNPELMVMFDSYLERKNKERVMICHYVKGKNETSIAGFDEEKFRPATYDEETIFWQQLLSGIATYHIKEK